MKQHMNQSEAMMKLLTLIILLFFSSYENECLAHLSVRVSIKVILDENGKPPKDAEQIYAQIDRANFALALNGSELRVEVLEIIEITDPSGTDDWYTLGRSQLESLREAAISNKAAFAWRDDAINVYVNLGNLNNEDDDGGGRALFPPENDIFILHKSISDDAFIHELGHTFNLRHPFDDDGCDDTIIDDRNWKTKDTIALFNFSLPYDDENLEQSKRDLVDMLFYNIMSLRSGNVLTPCQMDRMSFQGYADRAWIYSKEPVYVIGSYTCPPFILCDGSWSFPFSDLQSALDSNNTSGKVIVLEKGNYQIIQNDSINFNVDFFTRRGTSKIDR